MSLLFEPKHHIYFERPLTRSDIKKQLVIKNPDDQHPVAFKILTNANTRYNVRPPFGIIDKQSEVHIKLMMLPFQEEPQFCSDGFLVKSVMIREDQKNIPFKELWPMVYHTGFVSEHQLKCVILSNELDPDYITDFEDIEQEEPPIPPSYNKNLLRYNENPPSYNDSPPRPTTNDLSSLHSKFGELTQAMMVHQQEIINMRLQLLYTRQQKEIRRIVRSLVIVVLCILIGYVSRQLL
ncbi:hypothetical protein K492DRAFT_209285 [Lichtheimia hyalospora FSU 10163]|nr:hypothetical protein K492DRAFT_209285 [Lichtheimia hyalospora FSU 10163]